MKFEYKILEVPASGFLGGGVDVQEVVNKLNELGRQGWEVVSTVDTNMLQGQSRDIIIILKRIIENKP